MISHFIHTNDRMLPPCDEGKRLHLTTITSRHLSKDRYNTVNK